MKEKLNLIKEIILNIAKKHNIEIDRIILFGSRARGDYREDSDWDILIVTKEKIGWKKRKIFLGDILKIFAKIKIRVEILIVDLETLNEYGKWWGFVHYHAVNEGVKI